MKTPIFVGEIFGRLTALKKISGSRESPTKWQCQCVCGKRIAVLSGSLRTGNTRSCGCLLEETRGTHSQTHKMSGTPIHGVWTTMLNRCRNPRVKRFPDYGGRGIKVCKRWLKFENFFADMGSAPPGKMLERRDNDGNYEPTNCLWATRTAQMNNRRNNVRITNGDGRTMTLAEWARELGLPRATLATRYRAGHPPARILDISRRTNQFG